ncbi:Wadjet anti-phage system protein JetD domain-containing protein [Demequina silvatica]|uniref:Wadjet anti-phage system protein JetD domain-containing protein n=1 Tax=Demequina silvatica TaxID=1638988 RepID=UPI0007826AC7|nr:DUF3322 and DUF2220 domain-containing protein [Demequina silvatica]
MSAPVTPADLAARASSLCTRDGRAWAAGADPAPRLDVPLHPPTERAAIDDLDGARAWIESWRSAEAAWPVTVTWEVRNWSRVGAQQVPARACVEGADALVAVASHARPDLAAEWATMRSRCLDLRAALLPLATEPDPVEAAIRRHAGAIAALPAVDFAVLDGVVAWLAVNPTSGRRVRSLPIRGIDTKWLERHRAVVTSMVSAVTGREGLGLVGAPPLVRVRVLDPGLAIGGLLDVTAPAAELAALPLAPRAVVITENLETLLELPRLDGVVAVHGAGYAIDSVATLPWVRGTRTLYCGDLDSQGFAILNRGRAAGLDAQSVLMDTETLLAHRDLWVREPTPATGEYTLLTASERETLAVLRAEGHVRLEQERIPWEVALRALSAALEGDVLV